MLDLDKITEKFYEILNNQTSQDIIDWLEFNKNRDLIEKLNSGETFCFKSSNYSLELNEEVKPFEQIAGENNYALAA